MQNSSVLPTYITCTFYKRVLVTKLVARAMDSSLSLGIVESWTEWDQLREVWVGSLDTWLRASSGSHAERHGHSCTCRSELSVVACGDNCHVKKLYATEEGKSLTPPQAVTFSQWHSMGQGSTFQFARWEHVRGGACLCWDEVACLQASSLGCVRNRQSQESSPATRSTTGLSAMVLPRMQVAWPRRGSSKLGLGCVSPCRAKASALHATKCARWSKAKLQLENYIQVRKRSNKRGSRPCQASWLCCAAHPAYRDFSMTARRKTCSSRRRSSSIKRARFK